MNIRFIGFLSLLLLSSQFACASQTGPSTMEQSLGTCAICQDEMTQDELKTGLLVSGKELYGCSERHLFHRACLLNPDGTPKCLDCPICRALPIRPEIWERVSTQLSREEGRKLNLTDTQLTTVELTAIIKKLSKPQKRTLRELYISRNGLTKLSESIAELTHLTTLGIDDNQLTTIPESIQFLTDLRVLFASHNQLAVIPTIIRHLENLQFLDISYNKLNQLPDEIGELRSLQTLLIFNNKLTTLPYYIGRLRRLQELYADHNPLTRIPDTIANLTSLQKISVDRGVKMPQLRPEVEIEHF